MKKLLFILAVLCAVQCYGIERNVASQKIYLTAVDTANNTYKTGDAANITAYVAKDGGALTALGDTSASEVSSTNAPGVYVFDLTQTETNAANLLFTGKSSTGDVVIVRLLIHTTAPNQSLLSVSGGGLIGGIAGTINDFDELTSGAPSFDTAFQASATTFFGATGGNMTSLASAANLTTLTGYVDTEIGDIKTKTDFLPSATAGAAGGITIAGANAATTFATLTSTGAFSINGTSHVAQTGDAFSRLGAPAGASIAEDIANVEGGEGGGATPAEIWAYSLASQTGAGTASKIVQDAATRVSTALPDAASGIGSGLATTTNVTAGTASVIDAIEDLEVTGVADFTATQQGQILAALAVTADIGVPKSLTWNCQRKDGQVGSRLPVTFDPDDDVEVALRLLPGVLGTNDAVDQILSVELIDSDADADVDSPAFDDVGEAEIWMASGCKFRITGGTAGSSDKIKVRFLTEAGNTINAIVYALPQEQ